MVIKVMELKLIRDEHTDNSTIGSLYIDGHYFCYTLEDRKRTIKVDGKTCIPSGKYSVIIDYSNRFKRNMPHILNVPGFEGVRIHAGNSATDTSGCILLGYKKEVDWIGESRMAVNSFMEKLQSAWNDEQKITLEIV